MDQPQAAAPAVLDRVSVRNTLKRNKVEDIVKAKSKNELVEMANALQTDLTGCDTKQQIVDAMVKAANLPNPALRGRSSTDEPVAYVWHRCDQLAQAATKEKPMPRRKDVIALLQNEGVAFYTARTQFQAWFSATDKGRRRVADLAQEDLPKSMREVEEEGEE